MEDGLRALVAALGRFGAEAEIERILAGAGDPEPARAREAFRAAANDADLLGMEQAWASELLVSARPGFGARTLVEVARRYRQTRRAPLPPTAIAPLAAVVGSSGFLARLLLRHPHWSDTLACETGRQAVPPAPARDPIEPDFTSVRIEKYRGLLRIAARDLAGRDFAASLEELSDLADRCIDAGLRCASAKLGTPPPAVFALGKLGGSELNFSSDVDLLFVYGARSETEDLERNHAVVRLIQHFKTHMEAPSEDGFGYRVDLDLRPEGSRGVLANSVEAGLHYYESFGAEWERQALLRLRHVCGDPGAASAFARGIRPFVYRRGIDLGAIRNVRDMKVRIELERRRAGRDLETDLKEGPGGIRDVEFLVQALQLLHGGRTRALRTGNTLAALSALAAHQILPEEVARGLTQDYLWLRRAEHAVQMAEERQTHRFPREAAGQRQLARRMGYRELDGDVARARLMEDYTRTRAEVRAQFDKLVLAAGDG